ncbi:MAG: hypothetical protein RLZZ108_886 [Actinomycetota bacterium]|jgi:hypothetical protein
MSKKQLIAAITLAAFIGLPVGAQAAVAATPSTPQVSAKVVFAEDEDGYEDEDHEDEDHEDEDDDFEDDDEYTGGFEEEDDDEGTFVMPPVVVDPNKAGVRPARPIGPDGKHSHLPDDKVFSGEIEEGAISEPIQVQRVLPTRKTPTDVFVDTAVVGLGAVALGAATLGGMVGVRAIRARRSGENNDYFYGE